MTVRVPAPALIVSAAEVNHAVDQGSRTSSGIAWEDGVVAYGHRAMDCRAIRVDAVDPGLLDADDVSDLRLVRKYCLRGRERRDLSFPAMYAAALRVDDGSRDPRVTGNVAVAVLGRSHCSVSPRVSRRRRKGFLDPLGRGDLDRIAGDGGLGDRRTRISRRRS